MERAQPQARWASRASGSCNNDVSDRRLPRDVVKGPEPTDRERGPGRAEWGVDHSAATRRASLRTACITSSKAAGVNDVDRSSFCCSTCQLAASASELNTLCGNLGRA